MQDGLTPAEAVPARLNLALCAAAPAAAAALLWAASRAGSGPALLAAAVLFAFVNNTVFALLHEAVHGILHPHRRVNDALGRFLAAFFPTSFSLQRAFHLGHHRRNRTAAELFDYLRPGESRWLKSAQWYGLLSGLYWLAPPLSSALIALWPGSLRRAARSGSAWASQTSAAAMAAGAADVPAAGLRRDVLVAACVQALLAWGLGLTPTGWAACYAAFALQWSALQYADHAFSELDPRGGAWDLRVDPLTRLLFLNYHDHRAHHLSPQTPWLHLPARVDRTRERPTWLAVYAAMWAGPRPLPEGARLTEAA